MGFTSAVDKFEFLGTLARSVVCFAGLGAPVENVGALRGLLTTVGLGRGKPRYPAMTRRKRR